MAESVMVVSTVPPVQCWNFTVWISVCVIIVLSSSVLVLLLWVIYRRHTHDKGRTDTHTHSAVHVNIRPGRHPVSIFSDVISCGWLKTGPDPKHAHIQMSFYSSFREVLRDAPLYNTNVYLSLSLSLTPKVRMK